MRIAVSADLRAPLVDTVLGWLATHGHDASYFGPEEPGGEQDWPVVTEQAARAVADRTCDAAIVLCWTGTGACIVANKVPGVRAALCGDAQTAAGARKYNDANVLALSIRATSAAVAEEILAVWFSEPSGQDAWNRAQLDRVAKLDQGR